MVKRILVLESVVGSALLRVLESIPRPKDLRSLAIPADRRANEHRRPVQHAMRSLTIRTAVWVAFLSLMGIVSVAHAKTITAATCSQPDVQTAVNGAVAGDTVVVPAGTCAWTAPVSWTAPANVILQGAGNQTVLGGGDATVIVDNYASTNPLFSITTASASSTFRLFGFTFRGGSGGIKQNGVVALKGNSQNVRLDHSHFDLSTYSAGGQIGIRTSGWLYGVIDHNIFDDNKGISEGINIWSESIGGGSFGDGGWAMDTGFGTNAFMFIEDNTFNRGIMADDCDSGGKEVFRHNIVNVAQTQTHPTGSAFRNRGCRAKETYLNTFNGDPACNGGAGFGSCVFNALFLSSGPSLIWGNTAPIVSAGAGSGYQWLISLHAMRRNNGTYPQTATPNGWGYCGTSFNGTGSNWDQNSTATNGGACLDQPGRGKGDLLANDFPNAKNSTTGTIAWPHQALEPVYEWLDSITPVPSNPGGIINNYNSEVLVQNRDFYVGTSSFNGTSGVGSGQLSARPATCIPMVAYWATDTSTLYQCSSTNTWIAYYTPYTYPHPLVSSGSPGPSKAPPQNLRLP